MRTCTHVQSQVWQHALVMPALGRWEQTDPWGSLTSPKSQGKTLSIKQMTSEEQHLRLTSSLLKHIHPYA